MKKIISALIITLILAPCFAQDTETTTPLGFNDGDITLGGTLLLDYSGSAFKPEDGDKIKGPREFEFQFRPEVGFFISDRTLIGGHIMIARNCTTNYILDIGGDQLGLKDKSFTFGIGPHLTHFRMLGAKQRFGIYGTVGLSFETTGGEIEGYDPFADEVVSVDKNRVHGINVFAMPGMVYMPADWFFFDVRFGGFGIEYDVMIEKDDATDGKITSTHLRIGGNLNELFFGNTAIGAHFVF